MDDKLQKKYCPMTETIFYTLLALLAPNHGYGIMKFVRELTNDRVQMILVMNEENGKKTYQITEEGRAILLLEVDRLRRQYENGEKILGGKEV